MYKFSEVGHPRVKIGKTVSGAKHNWPTVPYAEQTWTKSKSVF